MCPRFNSQRDELDGILTQRIQPETIVQTMLSSITAWNGTNILATDVLMELRSIEKRKVKENITLVHEVMPNGGFRGGFRVQR